jgi:hypothetical protein
LNCLHEQKFATLLIDVPFKCHMNTFSILCRSSYGCLVISVSYHTYNPFFFVH